jgi:hypothetical protein
MTEVTREFAVCRCVGKMIGKIMQRRSAGFPGKGVFTLPRLKADPVEISNHTVLNSMVICLTL